MNRRFLLLFSLLAVVCVLVLLFTQVTAPLMPIGAKSAPNNAPAAPAPTVAPISGPPAVLPDPPLATPSVTQTPEQELQQVSFSIESFRKSLGANPVGANAEITQSLLGDNDKKLQIGLPDGVKQNAAGEMVDRWGTPYFFHQQSATEMEIRSAGPDRKLWTDDDLQIK